MKLHITGCLLLIMLLSMLSEPVSAQNTSLRGPKDATDQYSGVVFGPIDSNDTLWRVANRYRQNPNFTIYQVMVAIYELNPEAFEQENINLMVNDATLKLPSERYIARIDAQKARQKALADNAAWARMSNQPGDSLQNLKPPVPLVNQQDLTQTKTEIEDQLSQIDEAQARQFEALRNQFAQSIENVQLLLDDNRKLYDRIEQINEDLNALRGRVDVEVEAKVDEQLALQKELRELLLSDRAEKAAAAENSLINTLTSPMALIVGSGLLSLSLIAGLVVWLMRRKSAPDEALTMPKETLSSEPEEGIADLSTAIEADLATDESLTDDDLFNDDDLLDDVLSTELEDSLNNDDSFADLNDDMLVPEEKGDAQFDEGDSALGQDDLDSLFEDEVVNEVEEESGDAIDLAADEDLLEGFEKEQDTADLVDFGENEEEVVEDSASDEELAALLEDPAQVYSSNDEAQASPADVEPESPVDEMSTDADIDALLAAEQETSADSGSNDSSVEDDEQPEISIDDLLEENQLTEQQKEDLSLDDGPVGEKMLDRLDEEIADQAQTLDRLTDSITGEIDQIEMMGDLAAEFDLDETDEADNGEESVAETESKLQSIDAITEDFDEIDIDDIENSEAFDDPLSDELLAELEAELPEELSNDPVVAEPSIETDVDEDALESEIADELTDDLLAELEASAELDDALMGSEVSENDSTSEELTDATSVQEDLTQELLAELEQSDNVDTPLAQGSNEHIEKDELALENDADVNDELDALANEEAQDITQASQPEETDEELTQNLLDELNQLDQQPEVDEATHQASHSTDSEVESSIEDALDQALADFDKQLIDDIPSLSDGETNSEVVADVDDDILEQALEDFEQELDSFELEQEQDGVISNKVAATPVEAQEELENVPGLDDWLNADKAGDEAAILEEIDNKGFDEILDAIEPGPSEDSGEDLDLGVPDLDLNTLFSEEPESSTTQGESAAGESVQESTSEEDFVDVNALLAESDAAPDVEDKTLDLDVSLDEFSGITDEDDVFDVDKDAGQNANLDLARVYLEMEDSDAAKELLDEVLTNGSENQQSEAKALLDSLLEK